MSLQVISPYTQKKVCSLEWDSKAELEQKIANATDAYQHWCKTPIRHRIALVKKGLSYFCKNADQIAREITLQMGKPIRQAQNEVKTFFERAEYMLSIGEETLQPDILPEKANFHRRIEHVPLGVILNIGAWNYPLIIPVNVIVPALIAGNTVLLKHSPKTPLCGQHFEAAFGSGSAGHLVTNLVLSNTETSRLIRDPRIAHVAFTGSVKVGRHVYRQAAERLLDAGLELGGKDAAYVASDADLHFSVESVVDGACYNAGQSCCAVERVYVHQKHYSKFLSLAKKQLEQYQMGDPFSEDTTLGPLVSRHDLTKLESHVEDALKRGAKLLLGGKRWDGAAGNKTGGNFFLPTLLADVPNDAIVMQEESFGPIVSVQKVANDEEAAAAVADSRYGLTASIFTKSQSRAERFSNDLAVGTIFQNRCDYLDPALPWTGVRESGVGSTLSRYGFYGLTRRKAVHFRTAT
ncbi:MAG: aldehyde dehydrogenase family protein [Nitrospirota bacterium]